MLVYRSVYKVYIVNIHIHYSILDMYIQLFSERSKMLLSIYLSQSCASSEVMALFLPRKPYSILRNKSHITSTILYSVLFFFLFSFSSSVYCFFCSDTILRLWFDFYYYFFFPPSSFGFFEKTLINAF